MKWSFEAYTWQMADERYAGQVEHMLRLLSESGIEGFEPEVCMLGDFFHDASRLKDLLARCNVTLSSICYTEHWLHNGETDDEAQRAAEVIGFMRQFPGALLMLTQLSGTDRAGLRGRQESAIRCINDVARRAAEQGIACATHPNSPPGSLFRTREDYDLLLSSLDASCVGLALDTGHAIRGGMDPLGLIREYGPLVRHIHFNDVSAAGEWTGLGDGTTDIPGITAYLSATGYTGWLVVDDQSPLSMSDPDGSPRRSAAYISSPSLANLL